MLNGDTATSQMARALLTDGEREAIRDDEDSEMDGSTRSSHLSRVRKKLPRLEEDMRLLRKHRPEIYEEARDAIVEEELSERIERLEQELDELRQQVESG